MRALLQRVLSASVSIDSTINANIGYGFLILVGVAPSDTIQDCEYLIRKILTLRVFKDEEGKMNKSVKEIDGDILVVSQFTLFADLRKGNRPSWQRAAPPIQAKEMYDLFLSKITLELGKPVLSGVFGADMQISLINDGPVTIWLDSQEGLK
ncbi:MAG: D-tyrosyl-tRNA(Tyr) deacylase [Sphingobacteriia bacterium]|nr:D-tyrosyl-tRNA(Tyr) deacylase [Sphingobacteriia bacterium]